MPIYVFKKKHFSNYHHAWTELKENEKHYLSRDNVYGIKITSMHPLMCKMQSHVSMSPQWRLDDDNAYLAHSTVKGHINIFFFVIHSLARELEGQNKRHNRLRTNLAFSRSESVVATTQPAPHVFIWKPNWAEDYTNHLQAGRCVFPAGPASYGKDTTSSSPGVHLN